jgi:hypothetical protein
MHEAASATATSSSRVHAGPDSSIAIARGASPATVAAAAPSVT